MKMEIFFDESSLTKTPHGEDIHYEWRVLWVANEKTAIFTVSVCEKGVIGRVS